MLIIVAVAMIIMGVLYFIGKRLQKKQQIQKDAIREQAQKVTMLVIDKKMLPMKDAGLPKMVMQQTPKRYQRAKLPIVKAKIGPQIMNLICDDGIYDVMPVRGEVKAMVSGIYITEVKNVRGKIVENPKEKKSLGAKMRAKQRKYQNMYNEEVKARKRRLLPRLKQRKKRKGQRRSRIYDEVQI